MVQDHDGSDDAVDFLGAFLFVGFDVACQVDADVDAVSHPGEHRVTRMCELVLENYLHSYIVTVSNYSVSPCFFFLCELSVTLYLGSV